MASGPAHDWYLKEWLAAKGEEATIAWLERETGWTHRIASQLVNRQLRWNRDHLALAAKVLQIEPWKLLMHPQDANHIHKLLVEAEEYRLKVAEEQLRYKAAERQSDRLAPPPRRRKVN